MPTTGRLAVACFFMAACGGGEAASKQPPAPSTAVTPDAGVGAPGVTALPSFDPANGYHVDPDVDMPARPPARPARDRRPIQIILRSTPTGAMAMVDGVSLGATPTLWEGAADGTPHDFTFRLAGHGLARYRFIPVTAGVVHGTLTRLPADKSVGEAAPDGSVAPGPRASAPPPAPPPAPTIDAAPVENVVPADAAPASDAPLPTPGADAS